MTFMPRLLCKTRSDATNRTEADQPKGLAAKFATVRQLRARPAARSDFSR